MKGFNPSFRRQVSGLILLSIVGCFFLTGSAQELQKQDIVSVEKTPLWMERLRPCALDLLFEWEGRVYILAGPGDLKTLDGLRIPYVFESHRFPGLISGFPLPQGGINGAYHTSRELEADLQLLERSFPNLAKLETIGESLERRKIYALKISDHAAVEEEEAEIFFLGCHHAREWISVEVPYLLAKFLLEHYAADAEVRRIVDQSEIWIAPLINPDGLEYTIQYYRYWRKNRRFNSDGSFGVDINRNYGYNWGYDNEGSSPEPASETYRGLAAFSEPETQAVRDFFLARNFRALVSYHSFSQLILYPWGYADTPSDKEAELKAIAAAMSERMQPANGRVYGFGRAGSLLYVTNGDLTDWAFGVSGIPAYTIELPPVDQLGGGFFNAEQDIVPIFNENLPAALYLIDWSIQNFSPSPAFAPEVRTKALTSRKSKSPLRGDRDQQ
ncbi:MAG: M14 family metallopeptidase [Acidobacteriota bacterium]